MNDTYRDMKCDQTTARVRLDGSDNGCQHAATCILLLPQQRGKDAKCPGCGDMKGRPLPPLPVDHEARKGKGKEDSKTTKVSGEDGDREEASPRGGGEDTEYLLGGPREDVRHDSYDLHDTEYIPLKPIPRKPVPKREKSLLSTKNSLDVANHRTADDKASNSSSEYSFWDYDNIAPEDEYVEIQSTYEEELQNVLEPVSPYVRFTSPNPRALPPTPIPKTPEPRVFEIPTIGTRAESSACLFPPPLALKTSSGAHLLPPPISPPSSPSAHLLQIPVPFPHPLQTRPLPLPLPLQSTSPTPLLRPRRPRLIRARPPPWGTSAHLEAQRQERRDVRKRDGRLERKFEKDTRKAEYRRRVMEERIRSGEVVTEAQELRDLTTRVYPEMEFERVGIDGDRYFEVTPSVRREAFS
ncbi:hypothetical protein P280DRAFT_483156 [Massarina eburnea CBS 473.64]|uniref:Uncharacterized protein n=1 Tax=Massarina eburnea CBS 473.64 TaxID=1395130 RepID=A0A6A6RP05_9PLEO|nr:hypothetical protein P280DRAFT_483156 [Massarina eburnea CBS 473.64]